MLELLTEYGFRVRGIHEAYTLKNAIGDGHSNVVKFLLDGGLAEADVVSEVKDGLYRAAFMGALEMFELLEEYGFEVRSSTYLIEAAPAMAPHLGLRVLLTWRERRVILKWLSFSAKGDRKDTVLRRMGDFLRPQS